MALAVVLYHIGLIEVACSAAIQLPFKWCWDCSWQLYAPVVLSCMHCCALMVHNPPVSCPRACSTSHTGASLLSFVFGLMSTAQSATVTLLVRKQFNTAVPTAAWDGLHWPGSFCKLPSSSLLLPVGTEAGNSNPQWYAGSVQMKCSSRWQVHRHQWLRI